MIVESINSI